MELLTKKTVISLAIAGIFVVYSAEMRHQLPAIAKPSSLTIAKKSSNTAQTSATSNQATSSSSNSSSSNSQASTSQQTTAQYKDGVFTGSVANAYYGNVQVQATISGGQITNVVFLQYPDTHPTSVMINSQAMPYLKQEAIKAQNANVQIVSGATFTSQAFTQSLQAALAQARS